VVGGFYVGGEVCSEETLEHKARILSYFQVYFRRVVVILVEAKDGADLCTLPAGAYHIRLVCPTDGCSAGTSVIKTSAAVKPWSMDLKKMTGR